MTTTLARRLERQEAAHYGAPLDVINAADWRQQERNARQILAILAGDPWPVWTAPEHAQERADYALLAAYGRVLGWQEPPQRATLPDPTGQIALVLDELAPCTHPAAIQAGHTLAAWANARRAAGQDPDQAWHVAWVCTYADFSDALEAAGWGWDPAADPGRRAALDAFDAAARALRDQARGGIYSYGEL